MNTTSMLAGTALLGLFAFPLGLQDAPARHAPVPASASSEGQVARLFCVDTIADQANGACLQASSAPTLGRLLPYPGDGNVFAPPAFVGGGRLNTASVGGSAIGGGLGNAATHFQATVAGGNRNTAAGLRATVAGGDNNRAAGATAFVGGGEQNEASGETSTVAGGSGNRASGPWSAIGGGDANVASGIDAVVAGGFGNTASGDYNATVGGGSDNRAAGVSATVAGGSSNVAFRVLSTVGGGHHNGAYGYYSTVPGGSFNSAVRDHSFAAGRRALADHVGAFVWGDSRNVDKTSSADDEFNVYASGGARFFSNNTASTGVLLAPGGGSWTAVSDRAAKENVAPVRPREVLERVVALPIATWNYKAQADSIRHMGPMAQDFYAAFELGLGETTIDTVDPDGVALAAIQGLHALVQEQDAELAALRARLERLEEILRDAR